MLTRVWSNRNSHTLLSPTPGCLYPSEIQTYRHTKPVHSSSIQNHQDCKKLNCPSSTEWTSDGTATQWYTCSATQRKYCAVSTARGNIVLVSAIMWTNLHNECLRKGRHTDLRGHLLYDWIYTIFWKRQNCRKESGPLGRYMGVWPQRKSECSFSELFLFHIRTRCQCGSW